MNAESMVIIAGPTDDGELLFWSHDFGWASRDMATPYPADSYPLLEETARYSI